MESIWKQKGKKPKQLEEAAELPELGAHVWGYFVELSRERPANGFSPCRITSTAIRDWCYVSQVDLELWEVKAIRLIDEEWIKSQDTAKDD